MKQLEIYIHSFRDTTKSRTNTHKETKMIDGQAIPVVNNTHICDNKVLSTVTGCSIYQENILVDQFTSLERQHSDLVQLGSDYQRQLKCLCDLLPMYLNNNTNIVVYYNELALKHVLQQLKDILIWIQLPSGRWEYHDSIGTIQKPKIGGLESFVDYIGFDLHKYNANIVKNPSAPLIKELLMQLLPLVMNSTQQITLDFVLYKVAKNKHNIVVDTTNIVDVRNNRAFINQQPIYKSALKIGDALIQQKYIDKPEVSEAILEDEMQGRKERRQQQAIAIATSFKHTKKQ